MQVEGGRVKIWSADHRDNHLSPWDHNVYNGTYIIISVYFCAHLIKWEGYLGVYGSFFFFCLFVCFLSHCCWQHPTLLCGVAVICSKRSNVVSSQANRAVAIAAVMSSSWCCTRQALVAHALLVFGALIMGLWVTHHYHQACNNLHCHDRRYRPFWAN